jgi:ABC-type Co2+ transport system permease subunit
MSHLHIPDGVLPPWLWVGGLVLALACLWRSTRGVSPRRVAYQGALGGLILAAMAVPLGVLGVLEYHLTLTGPLGVLLGASGAFQVGFTVNAILACMGHGGLTVVGLNALVTGAGAAVAAVAYRGLGPRLRAEWAMAWSTAAGQGAAGVLWFVVVALGVHALPGSVTWSEFHVHGPGLARLALVAGPLWLVGVVVETAVAWGIGRFLGRVHPGLLPHGAGPDAAPAPVGAA